MKKITFILSAVVLSTSSFASQLVYQPINPTFGGNPMNGSMLMSKAQAQNKHKEKRPEKSYADKFQESLERSIMNKLIRQITDYANGEVDEDGNPIFLEDQLFSSGDYIIEVLISNPDTLTVQLTNSDTGEITIIEVPRFG
jgi:curli production assembly/transport component CsgF